MKQCRVLLKEIIHFLVRNDELNDVYPLAAIIVMSFSYRPMYWAVVNKLAYEKQTGQLWKLSFIAGALNIVLNFIFIPIYGIMAAAVTTFVAMMYLGFAGFALPAYRRLDDENHHPIPWAVGIVAITIGVYLLQDLYWQMKGVLTLGALGCAASLVWAFRARFREVDL